MRILVLFLAPEGAVFSAFGSHKGARQTERNRSIGASRFPDPLGFLQV